MLGEKRFRKNRLKQDTVALKHFTSVEQDKTLGSYF